MDREQLKQADVILSKCGGRRVSDSTSVVPIERGILMPLLLAPNQSRVFVTEVVGDTVWQLRAVSCDQTSDAITGVRLQIQLPNGRFLMGGNGQDIGQFAWVGSWRYAMTPPVDCQPGSKIQVTLTDMVGLGSSFACNLLFQGCYMYYLKNGEPVPASVVSAEPRYQGIVNENILAPCFRAGYGPKVPDGFQDDYFTYSSSVAVLPLAGPLFTTLKVPIDSGLDFQLRRLLVDIERDDTVTAGVVLGRLRAGSGYALCDDFVDLERYLAGAEYAHDWKVRGEDAVFFDLQLADSAGSGNVTFQAHLEGVRRRRY